MTGRRRLGIVAAAATLLSAAPLTTIFQSYTWLAQCILTVGLICGAGLLTRTLRFPVWAQALSMIGLLLLTLTWMYGSGSLIPGPSTFERFAELFSAAGQDTRQYAVPVPDRDGLLFVTVLGIGSVAVAVDLLTVVARRPALAGLPMLAIYSVPVAVYVESVPVLPFIVGAAGFLWLLVSDNVDKVRRFGRRFTGDGRDVDVWEPSPLAAAGRRLGVVGVAAAVLLPLAVPTITGGLLSQLTQTGSGIGQGGGGNGSGRVNLFAALSGNLSNSETTELVKVTTNEPEPFYLRFGVADQLTTQGFGNRPLQGNSLDRGLPDPRGQSLGGTFQQYRASVEITDGLRQSYLPVYSNTIRMNDLDGAWSFDGNQEVIYSRRDSTKGKQYTFDYIRARYSPSDLRTAEPLGENDAAFRELYTQHPTDPTVDDKVAELIEGKSTDYDKVRALYYYFTKDNGFTYSLSTQAAGGSTDIAAFLQTKTGYCQQYAAALAWMARAAGVPARVAFGFTRGDQRDGDAYVITNRNAHAWTEVYLKGFGWIPFDATPSASVPGSARSDWAPDTDETAPVPTASTTAPLPGAESSVDPGAANRPDPGANNPGNNAITDPGTSPVSTTGLWTAGLLALLVALLLVPALRRALVRRRRHAVTVLKHPTVNTMSSDHNIVVTVEAERARADAHAAWDELLDTMIDFRIPVDPTETPRVTAQRLVDDAVLEAEPASAATLLGTAEERARYARAPLQGGELNTALGQVRKGLARSANRRTRLVAAVFPPSVLLRWRLAMAEGSTRMMGAASRFRDSASRFSPRRLIANRGR
jgi:transglutaminase-like putative cysteine protease